MSFVLVTFGFIIVGLACWVLSFIVSDQGILKMVLEQATSVFMISGIFNTVQKYLTDKNMFKKIQQLFQLHESMEQTGVESIYNGPQAYDFTEILEQSKSFRVVLNDGNRWLMNNIVSMEKRFNNKDYETVVFTVDPDNEFIASLAQKTNTEKTDLDHKINDTWNKIKDRWENSIKAGKLKIYKLKNYPTYSAFLNESIAVVSLYQISTGRTNVPTFILRKNNSEKSFYAFVNHDIDELIKESTVVFDSESKS